MNFEVQRVLRAVGRYVPNSIYWRVSPILLNTALGRVSPKPAEYYFKNWARHLQLARKNGFEGHIETFAEIGPGDALGTGLCALLSGASRCIALDIVEHANQDKNLSIFEQLVELIRDRTGAQMAHHGGSPKMDDFDLPSDLLTELDDHLSSERLQAIRDAIVLGKGRFDIEIRYVVPWTDNALISEGTIDFLISNAVMEHVDDLHFAYDAFEQWMAPGGCMSHGIDFRCHGTANRWNGHWGYNQEQWTKIRGDRPYLLNREPYSTHRALIEQRDFRVLSEVKRKNYSGINRKSLSKEYTELTQDDLTTSGVLIQAIRN